MEHWKGRRKGKAPWSTGRRKGKGGRERERGRGKEKT